MQRVDLNCDLGEGAGHDAELMPLITSANIACGAHAGSLEKSAGAVKPPVFLTSTTLNLLVLPTLALRYGRFGVADAPSTPIP